MRIREIYSAIRDQWRQHKLEAAANRLDHLLRVTPRYWSACSIGGQVNLQLGKITHDVALRKARESGHEIAHVDLNGAFIALQGDPNVSTL